MQSIAHLMWNRGAINQLPINFYTVRLGIKGGNGLSMLCLFWEDLLQNLNSNTKNLFFLVFFFWLPIEVIQFALRQKGVPAYMVNGVMSLYQGFKTAVLVKGE